MQFYLVTIKENKGMPTTYTVRASSPRAAVGKAFAKGKPSIRTGKLIVVVEGG